MVKNVKGLVAIHKNLMIAGILPWSEQHLPFKLRKFSLHQIQFPLGTISQITYISSIVCFVLFQAKTFAEYAEVALFLVSACIELFFYIRFEFNSSKVSQLLTDLDENIELSKFKNEKKDLPIFFSKISILFNEKIIDLCIEFFYRKPKACASFHLLQEN